MTSRPANHIQTQGWQYLAPLKPPAGSSRRQGSDGRAGLHGTMQQANDPARRLLNSLNVVSISPRGVW